ncbi:LysR family transcriptional regulator [Anaeroselena agilis]|uniref:LysR family transcriptional regulator n=1 Tax=Anaeroselena agilis TaxID=3063788 RepID=A0ABU3P034_9FIRM|nr:LysR family transcriptional regulator [Selenomonadales bacterium 4137-cl]
MELRQLQSFLTAAKLASFSRAAAVLGYAQSTVTMQIKALEEELGTSLFDRSGRRIRLTGDGENLFSYAEQILRLAEEATETTARGSRKGGSVAVGTPESLCLHYLSPLLGDYRLKYPEVAVKLRFGTCCELYELLKTRLVDVAFFLDELIDDGKMTVHVLFDEPVLLLASPRHPLSRRAAVAPADLEGQPLIVTEPGCNYRARFERCIGAQGVKPCSTMEVSSVELIKRFARDNLGVAVLSGSAAQQELAAGQLVALPWTGPSFDVKAQLVHLKERRLPPALRAFVSLVLAGGKGADTLITPLR